MLRSSLVYSGVTMISRVAGLIQSLVVTAALGASGNIMADAYATAQAFPNLFRRIFAEGAFTAAFVPAYSSTLEKEGRDAADKLARDSLATLAAITVGLAILAQIAMPWIMRVFSPGYVDDADKFNFTVLLTQITMPYLPCMAIVALLSGVLNARGKFIVSALAPTLMNLMILAFVLTQKDPLGAAYAASLGILASGVAQVGLLIWGVRRAGARIGMAMPSLSPQIRQLMLLAIPGALAAAATQINIFVSQWLSSAIDGARMWLSVADRLYQLPLGLVGVAIGVALLPALSRAVAANDHESAQKTMDEGVVFALLFSAPAAAALIAIPYFLIDALFTRGEFHTGDALNTASALLHYGWGVPAFVLSRVLTPAFFARKDTWGPMKFAMVSVVVNVALGLTLFPILGVAGLAIGTSAAAWVNVGLMWFVLWRRRTWSISVKALRTLIMVVVCGGIMGGFLWLGDQQRPIIEAVVGFKEIAIVGLCLAGAVVYIVALFVTRTLRLSELKAVLRRG